MESMEELQARHRKEAKDLQGRITQKKKQATKKTRKGVNSECDELERLMRERQDAEVSAANGNIDSNIDDLPEPESAPSNETELHTDTPQMGSTTDLADDLQNISMVEVAEMEAGHPQKRNRQKERLARRAAEQEAAAIEAEKEAAKLPNWKRQERTAMLKAFKEHGLVEKEIQPDGHCLFSAVADQLIQIGVPLENEAMAESSEGTRYKLVRKTAARYIEGHPEDFAAFLDEPLGIYVHKIRDTAEWGGQVELIALAKSYNVEICVLQDGRIDRFGPDNGSEESPQKIWLAYYHHGYGLGEHYNSLRNKV
jgi:OTU domain-containing protein 6